MANTVNISINVNIDNKGAAAERKPYDNCEVKPGEVLVPRMADDNFLRLAPNLDTRNIRTWHNGGKKYHVVFYPIAAEFEEVAMHADCQLKRPPVPRSAASL